MQYPAPPFQINDHGPCPSAMEVKASATPKRNASTLYSTKPFRKSLGCSISVARISFFAPSVENSPAFLSGRRICSLYAAKWLKKPSDSAIAKYSAACFLAISSAICASFPSMTPSPSRSIACTTCTACRRSPSMSDIGTFQGRKKWFGDLGWFGKFGRGHLTKLGPPRTPLQLGKHVHVDFLLPSRHVGKTHNRYKANKNSPLEGMFCVWWCA